MKTLKGITVIMALVSVIALQGFTQNPSTNNKQKNAQNPKVTSNVVRGSFVDNNNDGICDNYQTRMKNGRSSNFVDKNGDGVCDNFQAGGQGKGNQNGCGMGYQYRHGQRNGNCCGRGYGYHYRHGNRNK
jgi:hypothetical protein